MKKDSIPSRARRKVLKEDVIISSVRPNLKHFGIIKKPEKNMIVSTGFIVLTAIKNIIDSYYLYNFFRKENIIEYLSSIAETSTTTYPSITSKVIEELEIKLPSLNIQKKISKILSDIDNKIELSNKINNNMYAQYNLGRLYKSGKAGIEKSKDFFKWYKKSAELGYLNAQYNLGNFYELGEGTIKNLKEAFKWYEKAAKQGHVEAQCKLGEFYEEGKEVEKDHEVALSWYKMAADRGKIEGKYGLAKCYYESKNKENRKKAETLFKELVEQNYKDSKSYLRKCQFKNIFF